LTAGSAATAGASPKISKSWARAALLNDANPIARATNSENRFFILNPKWFGITKEQRHITSAPVRKQWLRA
jgi:hypothetical protein